MFNNLTKPPTAIQYPVLTLVDRCCLRPLGLARCQHEGQDSENEDVKDADDGQDVGPADATLADLEDSSTSPTDALYRDVIPAHGVDDAAEEHAQPWNMDGSLRVNTDEKAQFWALNNFFNIFLDAIMSCTMNILLRTLQ